MKLLAPILVFLIAAQPAAAGFCDMDAAGDSPAQAAMAHHGETQGMDDSGSHDCCDTERGNEADPAPGCGHDMACGLCVIATSAVPALPEVFAGGAPAHRPVPAQSQLFTRHTSPPLRPPINVS